MRVAAWCESLSFLDWCESLCPLKDIRYKFMGHKLWHKCILLLNHYLNFNREFLPLVAEKTIQAIQGQIFCEEFLKKFLESGVKM